MSAKRAGVMGSIVIACLGLSSVAAAHCDALDGPVVRDARAALAKRDPAAVLKWVSAADEAQIRAAFAKTLAVRNLGENAQQLADQWFFETLVRVHRAGEGEGFTGLKPPGSIDPGIAAADAALESGSATEVAREMAASIEKGIRNRFEQVRERKKHGAESIPAGREYVEAYVDYVHFVEGVHRLTNEATSKKHHDDG